MVATFDFPVSGLSCYLKHKPDHLVHCFCGPAFLITFPDPPMGPVRASRDAGETPALMPGNAALHRRTLMDKQVLIC